MKAKSPRPPPARHKWVRPWLTAHGHAIQQLVAETLAAADQFEAKHFPRTRARRAADRQSREALVRALVVNLAHASLSPPPSGRLAIRAGNAPKAKTRYDHPAFGKGVNPLLIVMHEADLLDFRLPVAMRGEVSSIAPTDAFAARVRELGIGLSDFSRHDDDDGEEMLVLTRKAGTRAAPSTDRVDYEDTAETNALREEVRRVNAFLAAAEIDFVQDGLQPHIDPHERGLKRRFMLLKADTKPRWDRGGRLFGDGFWINLESSRRGGIRIQGERVADLDYSSMFARLAYAHVGAVAPSGDLYAIPGLEQHRSGVKLAFNVFLFDGKGLRKEWPKAEMGIGVGTDADAKVNCEAARFDGLLPVGWSNPQRLRKAILEKHPALGKAFGRRLGYGLMFTESRVLMAVLAELMRRGIVALPLHDGLLCAQSRKEEAAEVMRTKAIEVTGAAIPVEEKIG